MIEVYNDRKHFYHIARGSFEETKARLVNELGPKLNAFIRQTRVGPKES